MVFTLIVYSVVCQEIALFGIMTNINIICFIKQIFNDPVIAGLLGMEEKNMREQAAE